MNSGNFKNVGLGDGGGGDMIRIKGEGVRKGGVGGGVNWCHC